MTGWAVLTALGAAACYAVAAACQHHEAQRSSPGGTVHVAGLLWLLGRPLWLLGIAVDVAGLALHVTALGLGPVALVQPLQVTGLLFALPLGAALGGRRVRADDLAGAALVVAGLGLFLGLARISTSPASLSPSRVGALSALTLAGLGIGTVLARRLGPGRRAAVLGALAGAGFAVTAILLDAAGKDRARLGWSGLISMREVPLLVGLVLIGLVGLALSQAAFQVGSLETALPTLTVVDPVLAVVLGAVLLGEPVRVSAVSVTGYVVALALITVGVVRLARSEQAPVPPASCPAGAVRAGPRLPDASSLPGLLRQWRTLASAAGVGGLYGLALAVLPVTMAMQLDPDTAGAERLLLTAALMLLGAVLAMTRRAQQASRLPATTRPRPRSTTRH